MEDSDIINLYNNGWSIPRIKKQIVCMGSYIGLTTIRRRLKKNKIKIRTLSEQLSLTYKQELFGEMIFMIRKPYHRSTEFKSMLSNIRTKIILTKEFLYREYIINEKSCVDISNEIGCSNCTIANNLKKFNIPCRITGVHSHTDISREKMRIGRAKQSGDKHPRLGLKNSKEHKEKIVRTRILRGISSKGKNNPMYGKHHSINTIKKIKSNHKKNNVSVLEKNPNWRGGISSEPYDVNFNRYFKKDIIMRDCYVCMFCGMSNQDAKKKYSQFLHIHHIDYDKQNTTKKNCCSLCCCCNIKANYNREKWTKLFQFIMSNRYGYVYNQLNVVPQLFND